MGLSLWTAPARAGPPPPSAAARPMLYRRFRNKPATFAVAAQIRGLTSPDEEARREQGFQSRSAMKLDEHCADGARLGHAAHGCGAPALFTTRLLVSAGASSLALPLPRN